jgi:hypothetical protein
VRVQLFHEFSPKSLYKDDRGNFIKTLAEETKEKEEAVSAAKE